jgi:ABC-type Mn2+/Zn2+ transport system ATPase subunit
MVLRDVNLILPRGQTYGLFGPNGAGAACRVVISTLDRETGHMMTRSFVDIQVRLRPAVEAGRTLPVAFGVPMLVLGVMARHRYRSSSGLA